MAAAFVTDLWESIFTPGPTPTILKATNATFAALQITLLSLLWGTHSVHFAVLSTLCAGLWWSINWFAAELKKVQEEEAREEKKSKKKKKTIGLDSREDEDEGDDTETEGTGTSQANKGDGRSAESSSQQVKRRTGLAKKGVDVGEGGGTSTGVSTEDEWEKVSEGEQERY